MQRRKCAHCHKVFLSQSSLTRHLRHKLHCRYVWNFIRIRRQETFMDRTLRERAENALVQLPRNVLPDIQSTIDLSMWTAPAPPEEPDIIAFVTGAERDFQSFDDGILEDFNESNNDASEDTLGVDDTEEQSVDPEAPLRYHKPGIYVDSRYRSTVYAFTETWYEELRNQQLALGHNVMYPFSSTEEFEVVDFIREAGLSYDHIEKLMRLRVVSEQ